MFKHESLDTCCFECLIYMCFVFLYLPLFSANEHVSRFTWKGALEIHSLSSLLFSMLGACWPGVSVQ